LPSRAAILSNATTSIRGMRTLRSVRRSNPGSACANVGSERRFDVRLILEIHRERDQLRPRQHDPAATLTIQITDRHPTSHILDAHPDRFRRLNRSGSPLPLREWGPDGEIEECYPPATTRSFLEAFRFKR
jgi:hypothetical protein